MKYLSILSSKNDITESFQCEDATKKYAAKKIQGKTITDLWQAVK